MAKGKTKKTEPTTEANSVNIRDVLFAGILLVGTVIYVAAIIWIGVVSIKYVNTTPPPTKIYDQISPFIAQAILVLGGALATHLGAYLGITIKQSASILDILTKLKDPDNLAGLMAAVYFFALVAAIVMWAVTGFSEFVAQPLQDLAYTFLGVFAGALAVLGKG
jgi:predicted transporter